MRAKVPMPPFFPDKLPRGDVLTIARNCYPAENGYRSARGFLPISNDLPALFLGGASFTSSDSSTYLIAGHANGLSRLSAGEWQSLTTGGNTGNRWQFTQFGDYALAVDGGVTQEVDLIAGTAMALEGAPSATDIVVVGDHVVYAQPNGDLLRVRWSAFNNHRGNTLGTDQAGDQPMLTGGEVMGLAGGEFGVILQRQRLVRMSRTGDPDAPFQFDEITPNFGCASKASIAQAGRTVFFLSDRGFMALDDGQSIRPIGNEKFDRTFREQVGPDDFERLWAAVDPERSLVMWGVPGVPGTVWVYNWVLDRPSTLQISFEGLFPGFETSISLDELSNLYPELDRMPFSLDDPRFSGGSPRMYFVQNGKVGALGGAMLPAEFQTGQFAPADPKKLRIAAIWPETDATIGMTVTINGVQRRGDEDATRITSALQDSGRMPVQMNARYVTVNIKIADPDWTYIDGFEIEGSPGGDR